MIEVKQMRVAGLISLLLAIVAIPVFGQEEILFDQRLCDFGPTVGYDFGHSVAVGDTAIAVGAYRDPVNGNRSGSVFLYDVDSGSQLYKIVPADGQEDDGFGYAVSIDNGILAVSAPEFRLNTVGKIYLYDIKTGLHLRTIIGSPSGSPISSSQLGKAMAMDNGVILAAAPGDWTAGDTAGAAYLFDAATGAELAKLLPGGVGKYARFGSSVAMNNGVAVVGADNDSTFGQSFGAAYVFDVQSGAQLHQLNPYEPVINEYFGDAVAINESFVAVSSSTGTSDVYLYDLETGEFIQMITSSNSSAEYGDTLLISNGILAVGDVRRETVHLFSLSSLHEFAVFKSSPSLLNGNFGFSVAAEDGTFVVGANEGNGCSTLTSAAYMYTGIEIDTDSDGLLDDWEINGIPYTDVLGVEQRFMLPGADPMFKDVYVEMDSMTGISSGSYLDADVTEAFLQAPVSNPNGVDGIRFHLLQDDHDVDYVQFWLTEADGCWPADFAAVRLANFGTEDERTGNSSAELLAAKAKAYRYCVVADEAIPGSWGGCGDQPGDNTVLYVGNFSEFEIPAIFLHELGHNFGLGHGGGDGINGKINYPSIMNYTMTYPQAWNDDFWRLDFSRRGYSEFEDLNEFDLDESIGAGDSSGEYKEFSMPFGVSELQMGNAVRQIKYARLNGSPTDFGQADTSYILDGEINESAQQDLNFVTTTPPGISLPGVPSSGQVHKPHNDWANVRLKLGAAIGLGAPAPSHADDELTYEAKNWMDANFPVPQSLCDADLTGDGLLDFFDVSAFLTAFSIQDPTADFSGDGSFDFFDVSAFLAAFGAGCP